MIHKKENSKSNNIPVINTAKMLFSKELSAIHAYLCADGYVIKNPETQKQKYYYIGLRNTCSILLEDFQKIFEKEFNIKPRMGKDGRCIVQNKKIYYHLTKDFSYYSKDWNMPKLDKNNSKHWLRAYFDCEAWVSLEERKSRLIGLDSINQKGLEQIKEVLERFDIHSKMKKVKNRKIFRLFIYGKENLIKFQKEIDFLHPRKKEKLKIVINDYVNYVWVFPDNKKELKCFILEKAKIDWKRIRFNSIIKENLQELSRKLNSFKIESKIYGPWANGLGNKYYQLAIQKKSGVEKFKRFFK